MVYIQAAFVAVSLGFFVIAGDGRFVDEGIPKWLIQMVKLEDEEVRYGSHDVTGPHGLDRAANIVRCNRDIIQIREIGNPPPFQ